MEAVEVAFRVVAILFGVAALGLVAIWYYQLLELERRAEQDRAWHVMMHERINEDETT